MAEASFELNGRSYRSRALNAFQQLHIARRLAPLLAEAQTAFSSFQTEGDPSEEPGDGLDKMVEKLKPVFEALSKLPDAEVEYVVSLCLSAVTMEQHGRYVAIWNAGAKRIQFEDINISEMMQIAYKVIEANLGDFFRPPASQTLPNPNLGQVGR